MLKVEGKELYAQRIETNTHLIAGLGIKAILGIEAILGIKAGDEIKAYMTGISYIVKFKAG